MEKQKTTWDVLSAIDCNSFTEKKNGLTYLSWAWAWAYVKKNYPSANYEVSEWDGKPYLFDENLGYMVKTTVSIEGEKISMQLPVMDGTNKAQKHVDYTYSTKYGEKSVVAATMFDINTAIMRCLVKNLAMFGLGHYIYAGEDLPKQIKTESEVAERTNAQEELEHKVIALLPKINAAITPNDLTGIFNENKDLQGVLSFKNALNKKHIELEKQTKK